MFVVVSASELAAMEDGDLETSQLIKGFYQIRRGVC